jgi:N-formylglutamate deformylase
MEEVPEARAYERLEPTAPETPVVVEVPHAGLYLDPETLALTVAPACSIARDADLYADELAVDAPAAGASLLYARTSRYVVDLNRAETDYDADTVEGGAQAAIPRGVVWRLTTDGDPILRRPLPRSELERRLASVYRPYHQELGELLAAKRRRFGYAVLLCLHSMPSDGRVGHLDAGSRRADVVPGTRGRTSAAGQFIDAVDRVAREGGWVVRHDNPYRGGFSTAHYGRPAEGVHAIQIELARRLYMDDTRLEREPVGFARVRDLVRSLIVRLGEPDLSPAARAAKRAGG